MDVTGPDRGPHTLRGWLPWAVVGVVMLALAGVTVSRLLASGPPDAEDATSVQDVADLAVEAAETLDVLEGVELLCETPMDLYRMSVESTITFWRDAAGSEDPDIDYRTSDVDTGAEGSFVVDISSDEAGLQQEERTFRVFVEDRDGRSCLAGIGGVDDDRATTRLSREGYDGPSAPTRPPTPTQTPTPGR